MCSKKYRVAWFAIPLEYDPRQMELRRRVRFVPLSGAPPLAVGSIVRGARRNEILETFINALQSVVQQVRRQSVKLVDGLIKSGAWGGAAAFTILILPLHWPLLRTRGTMPV